MAFLPEAIGWMVNNPLIYRAVLNVLGKMEFKRDYCLKVRGLAMYSNTPDRLLASLLWKFGVLERYETKLMPQIVKPGMRVVDVGANIGYYTLLLARLVGPTGEAIAFEPDPNNYRLLVKNAARNHFAKITPVNKAITNYNGQARLFLNKGHRGDHRIFMSAGRRPSLEIQATTLDAYLGGSQVDVIKMDIQGAEMLALEGMTTTIAKNPRLVILTEFSPYLLTQCGTKPSAFLEAVDSAGFGIRMIDEKMMKVRSISKPDLMSRCQGTNYENLLLSKKP